MTKGFYWYLFVLIVCATITLAHCVHGAGWPTNYEQFITIRATAQTLDKGTHICFTLNDGTLVFGTFLKYESYTDYIWYQPQNTGHNWFKQDAFEVHELFRLDVVTEEPV